MPSPPTSEVDLCNGALLRLGQKPITALTDDSDAARLCNQFYAEARDATLEAHPWNVAIKRVVLEAFTKPAATLTPGATSGNGVTFTAGAGVFVAGDVGKELAKEVGPGRAKIVTFVGPTQVTADITQAFLSTVAIPAGEWRLYNAAPAFDFPFTILLPSDWLRAFRADRRIRYQVEGRQIVCDSDALPIRYIARVTDVTLYPPRLVQAIEALLASILAEPVIGQAAKTRLFFELWRALIPNLRATDGLEGTPEQLVSRTLIDVRR